MALPGFRNHPKFRRLVATLRIPEAHVLGHVEMMWEVCYESGNPVLGDDVDVELAAGWVGEPGAFCAALASCGGKTRSGLIEETCPGSGEYQVHDLEDHAPEYVNGRRKRKEESGKDKTCAHCGKAFRSADTRAKFCCDTCRKVDWKARHQSDSVTQGDAQVTDGDEEGQTVTQGDAQVTDGDTITRPAQTSPDQGTNTPSGGVGGIAPPDSPPEVPLRVPRRPREPKAPPAPPGTYPPHVADAVNQIATLTPARDPQDRSIKINPATLADRLSCLFQAYPGLSVEIAVQSWVDYLATKPAWIKAPHYFFGRKEDQKEGAHWHAYAAFIWHKQAKAKEPS